MIDIKNANLTLIVASSDGGRGLKKTSLLALAALIALSFVLAGCNAGSGTKSANAEQPKDDSWTKVEERGELVVGQCAEYPPFSSRNDDGESEGFDVDFAHALGDELGVDVKVVDSAWEGLLGGVLKGDFDVLISAMSKEEASAERVNTSEPYYDLPEVVVTRKGYDQIASVEDLEGKVIGVQSACSSEQAVDRLTGLKEIKRYTRNSEAFIDLRNGRVDAVVVGIAYAATEAKKDADLQVLPDVKVAVNPLVVVSKADGNELTNKVNEALVRIQESGTYDALVAKWLSF